MRPTDECTTLNKSLPGWTKNDLRKICAFACDKVPPRHAFFARLLEPAFPNFCAQLFVWSTLSTARHESCCRNGQPRRWSAPASEELAKRNLPTTLTKCVCPHLESCCAARQKNAQTSQRTPCPSSQPTVADVCAGVRSTLAFSVTASTSCELETESCGLFVQHHKAVASSVAELNSCTDCK